MAYEASERYTLAFSSHSNSFRVPAVERERQRIGYNDGVQVTLHLDESDALDTVTFTAFINANNSITIPVSIRDRLGIHGATQETVTVSLEATGEHWTPDIDATARKGVHESAHPDNPRLEAVTDIVSADD